MHELVILTAKYLIGIAALLTLFFWLRLPTNLKKQFIIFVVLGAVFTVILAKLGSLLFYDPRPFVAGHFTPYFSHGNDNGFPSDHTLLASFLAFSVMKYHRTGGVVLLLLAALIGLARVIAGVHHLIDILGAMLCAALSAMIGHLIVSRMQRNKRNTSSTAPAERTV